jgi:lipoprotein NlpI
MQSIRALLAVALLLMPMHRGFGAEPTGKDALEEASNLFRAAKKAEAYAVVEKLITAEPTNAKAFFIQGSFYMQDRQPGKAVDSLNKAIALNPKPAAVYQTRGEANFQLGRFKDSLHDFTKVVEIEPEKAPYHWQRGISCYYAKQYEEGRKQFELHRTVNANDVENAVWHYLCVSKISGVQKAKSLLIPMAGDPRIPMKEIYELYGGRGKPEDVMKAAKDGPPSPQLNEQIFYADLYLGLWHEAQGNGKEARIHILKAAGEAPDDYMGTVARVHARVLDKTQP